MWQMHASIPLEDMTHETFWRQLLRWLVDGVPDRVEAIADRERVETYEEVQLTAEIRDSAYAAVNEALVTATVEAPDGTVATIPLAWTLDEDGEFRGSFRPQIEGPHEVVIDGERGEESLGTTVLHLDVGPFDGEYFDAGLRRPLLERLAEETGGRFYTPDTVEDLPEDLQFTGTGVTLIERRDLWDMPIFFILLVLLVGAEWVYRKRRGLV